MSQQVTILDTNLPRWIRLVDESVVHVLTVIEKSGDGMARVATLCRPGMAGVRASDMQIPVYNHCWCTKCMGQIKKMQAGWGRDGE